MFVPGGHILAIIGRPEIVACVQRDTRLTHPQPHAWKTLCSCHKWEHHSDIQTPRPHKSGRSLGLPGEDSWVTHPPTLGSGGGGKQKNKPIRLHRGAVERESEREVAHGSRADLTWNWCRGTPVCYTAGGFMCFLYIISETLSQSTRGAHRTNRCNSRAITLLEMEGRQFQVAHLILLGDRASLAGGVRKGWPGSVEAPNHKHTTVMRTGPL